MTEIKTVPVGDMKVRVSGTGFPLIMLHGYTTTSEFWREQVEELSRSYQAIRPNLPGHGISAAPPSRQYTIDAFVADLEGLFQHFSLRRAALVGLSMGGVISQHFALRNPQLLQALVLVDTTSHGIGQNGGPEAVLGDIYAVVARAGGAPAAGGRRGGSDRSPRRNGYHSVAGAHHRANTGNRRGDGHCYAR